MLAVGLHATRLECLSGGQNLFGKINMLQDCLVNVIIMVLYSQITV